jgi:hypothetical protein
MVEHTQSRCAWSVRWSTKARTELWSLAERGQPKPAWRYSADTPASVVRLWARVSAMNSLI